MTAGTKYCDQHTIKNNDSSTPTSHVIVNNSINTKAAVEAKPPISDDITSINSPKSYNNTNNERVGHYNANTLQRIEYKLNKTLNNKDIFKEK